MSSFSRAYRTISGPGLAAGAFIIGLSNLRGSVSFSFLGRREPLKGVLVREVVAYEAEHKKAAV